MAIVLEGMTSGSQNNCFWIKHWDMLLDIGICSRLIVSNNRLLLTHAHSDHAGGLVYYLSQRRLFDLPPCTIFAPAENIAPLTTIIQTWEEIEHIKYQYQLVGICQKTDIMLTRNCALISYPVQHRVPAVGYTICQTRQKLCPEYVGYPPEEIQRLRKENPKIVQDVSIPWLSYLGDCNFDSVLQNPSVLESRYLLLECTYIDDKNDVEHAHHWGHIHWQEIVSHADIFDKVHRLILTHFSSRYSLDYIRETIKKQAPDNIKDKIIIWTARDHTWAERTKLELE